MVTYSIFLSFQLLIRSVILGISVSWEKAKFWSKIDSYRLLPSFFNILDSSCLWFFLFSFFLTSYTLSQSQKVVVPHKFSLWFLATETGFLLPDKKFSYYQLCLLTLIHMWGIDLSTEQRCLTVDHLWSPTPATSASSSFINIAPLCPLCYSLVTV